MATLAFSSLGTALAGPIGGAIGSLVGGQVDRAIFDTGTRQGPRLRELAVTGSSYGIALPRHFGRMRVGGAIIWATDLVEHAARSGGGKTGPSLTTYSYTANFAVALSSRPIAGIGRIWADGQLLRGAAGDLKVSGTMRLYTGHGDAAPDPLIATSEGFAHCPAHRDLAYVVFEDLDLSDFYNRIPSLSFEVFADDSFDLADLAADIVDDIDAAVDLDGITGFSLEGSLSDTLALIDQVLPLDANAAGTRLVLSRARAADEACVLPEPTRTLDEDGFASSEGQTRRRAARNEQPIGLLRYHDAARDYLPGLQRSSGRAGPGTPRSLELPAALDPATARAMIEQASRRHDWARETVGWRTAELDTTLAPGSLVSLPGQPGHWRVREWEWLEGGVELALERILPEGAARVPSLAADPGQIPPPRDRLASPTSLVAFELPLDAASTSTRNARPFAAVSGPDAGWRGAALYADRGDGDLHPLGTASRNRALLGVVAGEALAAASPLLLDRASRPIVTLIDPAMQLIPASIAQLAQGANRALIGDEVIQFADAQPLGEGRWRISRLLRGIGGTEEAIRAHLPDENFVLLDDAVTALDAATLGSAAKRRVLAQGPADTQMVSAPLALDGVTLRPLSPVHPHSEIQGDAGLLCRWTRRARGAWDWADGIDVPLVEESESYIVTYGPLDAPLHAWTTEQPAIAIPAATLAAIMVQSPGFALQVRQRGTHALSPPLRLGLIG